MSKRQFPYYSAVEGLHIQKRQTTVAGVNPGIAKAAPRIFEAQHTNQGLTETVSGTDFTSWTEDQIKAFLDQRGEDYDDWFDMDALVVRAQECEANTGSAGPPGGDSGAAAGDPPEDDEDDALDAFMAGIDKEVTENKPSVRPKAELALDEEDAVADYMEARQSSVSAAAKAAAAMVSSGYGSDEEVYRTASAVDAADGISYDSDDNQIIAGVRGNKVEPLAPLDHEEIEYEEFGKNFYEAVPAIVDMTEGDVNTVRRQLGLRVAGFDVPRPVQSFAHFGFDAQLLAVIKRAGYEKPTGIQCQALPAALSGRDVLGIAKTGSGKTAAFVLPMIVHIMDQPELGAGEGPIAVIVAPTRELAEQIHREVRRFSKGYGIRACAAFGGLNKYDQCKDLKAGSEVAVCTPGRMIDLIKMKACTMRRATFLVFDEADRMFDMGFEPQVRSLLGQVRPDRQTLLFSATMPRKVESLVRDALTAPIRITVGIGGANEDIKQVVAVMEGGARFQWLKERLPALIDAGDVLIFAAKKVKVDELTAQLSAAGFRTAAIHGDMDQHTRMETLNAFKAGKHHVLVATDVAARGLDIKSIKSVVNYDAAKDIDTHVHRIGRTGRAGDKEGVAYTLLMPHQSHIAADLLHMLTMAHQDLPPDLLALARKDSKFRIGSSGKRGGQGGGSAGGGANRRRPVGGAGLGFETATLPVVNSNAGIRRDVPGFTPEVKMGFQAANEVEKFSIVPEQVLTPPSAVVQQWSGGQTRPSVTAAALPGPPPWQQQQQQQQQLPRPPAMAATVQAVRQHNPYADRFKSKFVNAGSTVSDINARATVVMPKQAATSRSTVPPPIPMSQMPLYLQRQMPGFNQPIATSRDTANIQEAIAAAKAAAARFGVQSAAPSGSSGVSYTAAPPPAQHYGHGGGRSQQVAAPQSAAMWRDILDSGGGKEDTGSRERSDGHRQNDSRSREPSSHRNRWDSRDRSGDRTEKRKDRWDQKSR